MREARTREGRRRRWWPGVLIACAAAVFCWPVFLGRVMLPADMCLLMLPWRGEMKGEFPAFMLPYNPMLDPIQQYLPWRIYAVQSLREGLIPLWNPYAFCGTPFLANLQSSLLYPPNLLFLLTGARHGFGVSAVLHLTVGGLLMYAFLRTLRVSSIAAVFGALVLMFNGFTVAWLETPTLSLWVFMWLPGILLCYERSLRSPGAAWPLLCALAVGLQFLGGHLQISAYVVMAFLLYALVRFIDGRHAAASRVGIATYSVLPIAVGLALAAGQVLPTLELAGHAGRVSHEAGAATTTALPLSHLILYLVPNFYGNPVDYNYWGNIQQAAINFQETACYVGVLPLFLAVWGLLRRRGREVYFFAGTTLFALLVAVGSPVYLLVYHLAPGFKDLAGLARILCLGAFGIAGMSAVGLDDLLRQEERRSPRSAVVLGAVLIGVLAASLAAVWPTVTATEFDGALPGFAGYLLRESLFAVLLGASACVLVAQRARLRIGTSAFGALAVALLVVDLFGHGMRFNPFTHAGMAYPQTETTEWLQEHADHYRVTSLVSNGMDWMAHNSPMVFELRDIHGSDSLRVQRSFELVAGPELAQDRHPEPDSPLMDALGVRYLVTRAPVGEGWRQVRSGQSPVYENEDVVPRAYVTRHVEMATSDREKSLVGISAGELAPMAYASPEVAEVLTTQLRSAAARSSICRPAVRFETDDPNAVALSMDLDDPGLLVLSDSYYPGWRAWVDGESVDIHRVNYGFRGVVVPAGRHTVEMEYEPGSFQVGLFLSLAAMAALGAWGAALYLRSRSSAAAVASRP